MEQVWKKMRLVASKLKIACVIMKIWVEGGQGGSYKTERRNGAETNQLCIWHLFARNKLTHRTMCCKVLNACSAAFLSFQELGLF